MQQISTRITSLRRFETFFREAHKERVSGLRLVDFRYLAANGDKGEEHSDQYAGDREAHRMIELPVVAANFEDPRVSRTGKAQDTHQASEYANGCFAQAHKVCSLMVSQPVTQP